MSTLVVEPEISTGTPPIILQFEPALNLTEDQFFEFCQINRELILERTAQREVVIMSPLGGLSGRREAQINKQLANWAELNGTGEVFSPSTGYRLPDGSVRSPDASWVSFAQLKKLTADEAVKFLPLCPEFVIELRSPTDRVKYLQEKMADYMDNGAQMGLLIIPELKQVFVYRKNQPALQVDNCDTISCDPVLPGFELDLRKIW